MFFRQVLYRDLGCASYLLGDAGEAVVVDPRWDIDVYLELAGSERLQIAHVIDTHDHADHVSGRERLARVTGARAYRPGDGAGEGPLNGAAIRPGNEIAVGSVRVRALATPGHRPEHLSLAVTDHSRSSEPWMILSGDSLLVGDIARPDLAYEASAGARALRGSLATLLGLGDHVEVWPAHVGGSLCGGAGLSSKTSSTIGFERHANPILSAAEAEFIEALTSNLPSRPPNIERIVELNRSAEGSTPAEPEALSDPRLSELLTGGATVLDCRSPALFDDGHLAGAINLPVASPGVGTRAGWALDSDRPVVIVAEDSGAALQMVSALQAVGFSRLEGYDLAARERWERVGLPVAQTASWDLAELAAGLREHTVELVDVRELHEWQAGHIEGSHHIPLHRLRDFESIHIPERGVPTAVACAAGARAAFAASLLRQTGRSDVVRVAGGGIGDLGAHGLELTLGS